MSIIKKVSLVQYFNNNFTACAADTGVEVDPKTIAYVIDLLCRYVNDAPDLNSPLGIMLQHAHALPIQDRLSQLQSIGDHALYMSGYMRAYVSNKHSSPSYMVQLGQDAYQRLAHITKAANPRTAASDLFRRLSGGFRDLSDVLSTMSMTIMLDTSKNGSMG